MNDLAGALSICGLSDPGMVRPHNEDAISMDAELGLVILADGMGGYNAGEVASGMATSLLSQQLREALGGKPLAHLDPEQGRQYATRLLQDKIAETNKAIFQAASSQPQYAGMGTTLVVALFHDNQVSVAHIGDSRLYRLRQNQLSQITRDHSLLQEQLDSGLITAEEARHATHKNLVTRALGIDEQVEAEIHHYPVEPGDIYLLCSDGLNDMVEDPDIELTLNTLAVNLPLAAQHLIQTANDNGGRDNVSAILIRVDRSFAVPRGFWRRLCALLCR